jgi:NTP-dependent ternary system trypsin peptidase co-occuring protein
MGRGEHSGTGQRWATLAEAIQGIRVDLQEAMAAGVNEPLRFDVGPVELEFTITVQRDAGAKAGVKIWVVEIGGSGGMSHDTVQRIKVTLNPVDVTTGGVARIGDEVEGLPPRPGTK